MKLLGCLLCLTTGLAAFALKPVVYRLASLPATAEQGQQLLLCATNIGTGPVDVSLEFINVKTGSVMADKTVSLSPLGGGSASQPCLTATAQPSEAADSGPALIVGVAMVRRSLLSFREAQVTASIQVMAPDASGTMRTVQTIPLSRTAHPADGAPVYVPPADSSHHK